MTFENLSTATATLNNEREAYYAAHKDAFDTMKEMEKDASALRLIQQIEDALEKDNAQMPTAMYVVFSFHSFAGHFLNIFDCESGDMVASTEVEDNVVKEAARAVDALGGRQVAHDDYKVTKAGMKNMIALYS